MPRMIREHLPHATLAALYADLANHATASAIRSARTCPQLAPSWREHARRLRARSREEAQRAKETP